MEERPSSSWAKGAAYMGLAFVPAISGWLGYKGGEWIDQRNHSNWAAVAGLLLGLAAGFYDILRQARKIEGRGNKS
jgi:F0F1-type ATP synthase assembly protein I